MRVCMSTITDFTTNLTRMLSWLICAQIKQARFSFIIFFTDTSQFRGQERHRQNQKETTLAEILMFKILPPKSDQYTL
jgi:hypothetical protein